jgi:O-antigen ligase
VKTLVTLRLLEGADPTLAILLAVVFVIPTVLLLLKFRAPSLIFVMLVIGSCVALRWDALNAIGLLGKYPLLLLLAIVGAKYHGSYSPSWFAKAYIVYVFIILVALFNPRAHLTMGETFEGFFKVAAYLLCYVGILVLTAKICSNERHARQILTWLAVWSVIIICIQFPFWSLYAKHRLTGIYGEPGTLQHSLARSIIILLVVLIARARAKSYVAILALVVAATGMMILTGGRTAIGSVVLALPLVWRIRPGRALLLYIAGLAVGAIALVRILPTMTGYGTTVAHLTSTDSHRFDWWARIWPEITSAPFLGHGTGASENFATGHFGHTLHNSFLDLAFDYGLVFAAAFLAVLGAAILRAWRQISKAPTVELKELAALSGALLIMLVLEGFFLSDLVRINLKWFLVCMCIGIQEGVAYRLRALSIVPPPGALLPQWHTRQELPAPHAPRHTHAP